MTTNGEGRVYGPSQVAVARCHLQNGHPHPNNESFIDANIES